MASKRPNILFVFADEWRAQALGYAGDPNAETPHLDAFAAESMNLEQAVSGCPVCCPYRASLMTGLYPLSHGVFINDVELAPDHHTIARHFGAAGYRTGYIGKWHIYGSPDGHYGRRRSPVPRDYQMGFDDWWGFECSHNYLNSPYYHNDDPTEYRWEGYDAFAQTDLAIDYMQERAAKDEPFMLMLSWGPPHFPLNNAPEAYQARYADRDIQLPPNVPPAFHEQAREELRGYYAHIAALDDAWARLMAGLAAAGVDDNTIVVFTADHGEMRWCHGIETKLVPWAESLRVPCLVRWPGGQPAWAGQVSELPVDAPDWFPTLAGLCGLEQPAVCEGRDWSPVLRGEEQATGDELALIGVHAAYNELPRNQLEPYRGVSNADVTYAATVDGPWLLYDNREDPYQLRNLVDDPSWAERRDQLDAEMRRRLDAVGDAFEPGPVLIERAGLSHYKELRMACERPWKDYWQQS